MVHGIPTRLFPEVVEISCYLKSALSEYSAIRSFVLKSDVFRWASEGNCMDTHNVSFAPSFNFLIVNEPTCRFEKLFS